MLDTINAQYHPNDKAYEVGEVYRWSMKTVSPTNAIIFKIKGQVYKVEGIYSFLKIGLLKRPIFQ